MRRPVLRVRQYVPAPYFYLKADCRNREVGLFMKKLYDVVVLRSLAIVMVVAFHAYGMMYWGHFPDLTEKYKDLYYSTNQYVVNFRMPLFIFISGYLFSYLERERGKYPTFLSLLKNKFKRLIIPYFIFATIYMLTTGMGFDIKTLMSGSCAHLWFITMLFWCFISTRLFHLIPCRNRLLFQISLLVISFIVLFVDVPVFGFLGIGSFQRWFFWFYFGYTISPFRNQIYNYLSKRKIWLLVFALVYLLELLYTMKFVESADERGPFVRFAHLSIVLLIWFLTNWAINNSSKPWYENVVFKELNRTSYGIYVLHYWLQPFFISSTAKQLLHIDTLAATHVVLFPFLFFLTSLALSYVGAKILLRTRIGRFLIG